MSRFRLLVVLLLALALPATWWSQSRLVELRDRLPSDDDALYLPRPSVLRAISLGYHELAADFVFVRAVVYFGAQMQARKEFRWLDNYLTTIVELDPQFEKPYRWAAVATMYNGKEITRAAVLASNHFLELGMRAFPNRWEYPFMIGCNFMFELHPVDETERVKFQRIAADYMQRAALVGGGPPWVPLLAATILRKEGEQDAAIRHLEEVYAATQDENTKEEVRRRLIGLRNKVDLERAQADRTRFDDSRKANYPYISPDLFVFVGEHLKPVLDYHQLAPQMHFDDAAP